MPDVSKVPTAMVRSAEADLEEDWPGFAVRSAKSPKDGSLRLDLNPRSEESCVSGGLFSGSGSKVKTEADREIFRADRVGSLDVLS